MSANSFNDGGKSKKECKGSRGCGDAARARSSSCGSGEWKNKPRQLNKESSLGDIIEGRNEENVALEGTLKLYNKNNSKKHKSHFFRLFRQSSGGRARLQQYSSDISAGKNEYDPQLVIIAQDIVTASADREEPHHFVVQAKDFTLHLAADNTKDRDDWVEKILEVLLVNDIPSHPRRSSDHDSCENITLPQTFDVHLSRETQERMGDDGLMRLIVEAGAITVMTAHKLHVVKWPMNRIRMCRYSHDSFDVEAGRDTEKGEGIFKFNTTEAEDIHRAVRCAKKKWHSRDPPNVGAAVAVAGSPDKSVLLSHRMSHSSVLPSSPAPPPHSSIYEVYNSYQDFASLLQDADPKYTTVGATYDLLHDVSMTSSLPSGEKTPSPIIPKEVLPVTHAISVISKVATASRKFTPVTPKKRISDTKSTPAATKEDIPVINSTPLTSKGMTTESLEYEVPISTTKAGPEHTYINCHSNSQSIKVAENSINSDTQSHIYSQINTLTKTKKKN